MAIITRRASLLEKKPSLLEKRPRSHQERRSTLMARLLQERNSRDKKERTTITIKSKQKLEVALLVRVCL